jgi:hypothetical protein
MLEFWLPMLFLFVAAAVAAIVARRKRDRCLKYLDREPVFMLLDSGKWLWGRLSVYPKAMELVFESPEADADGLQKASYVLYPPEVDGIKKIIQPPPPVGTAAHRQWQEEIQRIAHPSVLRRFRRWVWNLFNTLRDAFSQALSMVLGTLKTKTSVGKVAGADKRAGEIGQVLLGAVPQAYEPILEKYLSKQVVVEMLEAGEVVEYAGLLQEYSGKYLLLRNVKMDPPAVSWAQPLPDRFDVIFPRSKALIRHQLLK